MEYAARLEARLRAQIQRRAFATAPAVLVGLVLTGCLDPHDYGQCLDKADRRSNYVEVCGPAPADGICPNYDTAEAEAIAREDSIFYANCGGNPVLKSVKCGPESWGEDEPQETCCYVAKIKYPIGPAVCEGRPFLVGGLPRVADIEGRSDWHFELAPEVIADPAARRAAVNHWRAAALAEHASVAAFARFTLQLLSLGAPPDLLREAQRACADEIRHAQLCFGLASALDGRDIGPAALFIKGALEDSSVNAIVETTIIEGCVGETIAAFVAAVALAKARDPGVRAVLAQIRDDETRHAELAWSFLAWLLSERPSLRSIVEATFSAALADPPCAKTAESAAADLDLSAHGILSDAQRVDLEADLRRGLLRRCADALLGHNGTCTTTADHAGLDTAGHDPDIQRARPSASRIA